MIAVDHPDRVRLWQATNPNARDFRLESIGPVWTSTDLANIGPGIYRGYVPPPPQGWTAFMVELTYEESGLLEPNQVFTTDVVITPDTLPFADIDRATADCLFNWAETNYPGYFSPSGAITQKYVPYTYRYYSITNIYLGVSAIDKHVYYQIPSGERIDVGESSYWLTQANCQ